MKWVKTAIGAVIAISVIPMIVLSVFNLTQEKVREEVVTFEILGETTVTSNTYDKIILFESTYGVYNLDVYVNDVFIDKGLHDPDYEGSDNTILFIEGIGEAIYIYSDDTSFIADYPFVVGDIIRLVGELTTPPLLSGVTATLVSLVSLVFISAILYSFYNIQKKEGE